MTASAAAQSLQPQPQQPPGPVAPRATQSPGDQAPPGPEEITDDVDDTMPPPPGYTSRRVVRKGLIVGGGVTFAVSYLLCLFITSRDQVQDEPGGQPRRDSSPLAIPFAGPFILMARDPEGPEPVMLATIGGIQLAGAILLIKGFTSKKRIFVRNDLVSDVTVAPLAGHGATGMVLSGRF